MVLLLGLAAEMTYYFISENEVASCNINGARTWFEGKSRSVFVQSKSKCDKFSLARRRVSFLAI